MSKLQVVVGGQYGSEGKGAVAAYLSARHDNGLAIRVAGPNAGHTVIGDCPPGCENSAATKLPDPGPNFHASDRHPWRLRQVPVAAVSNRSSRLAIAAGSEIDMEVLAQEILDLDTAGYEASHRLLIDEQATLVDQAHKDRESAMYGQDLVGKIGSTGKGIGAARAARAMRQARLARDGLHGSSRRVSSVATVAAQHLSAGGEVLVEGTQGYWLGTHAGHYPQCTSSDCTATDMLAMAGLAPWLVKLADLQIWVVFRTYPIRVAGNSGPLPGETTWEGLGLEPELTTVTRKVRRVAQWDGIMSRAAMSGNGHTSSPFSPVRAALTMADYVLPGLAGLTSDKEIPEDLLPAFYRLVAAHSKDLGRITDLVGTGPSTMIDLRGMAGDLAMRRGEYLETLAEGRPGSVRVK